MSECHGSLVSGYDDLLAGSGLMGLRLLASTTAGKVAMAGLAVAVIGGGATGAVILTSGGSTETTLSSGPPHVSCLPQVAPDPTIGLLITPIPTAVPALPSLQVAVDALQCNGKPLSSTSVTLTASGGSFSPSTKLSTPCSEQQCTLTTNLDGLADVALLVTTPPNTSPTVCTPEDVTGTPNSCLETILQANVSVTATVMDTTAKTGPDLIQASTITNQGGVPNDSIREPVAFTIGYPPGTAPPQNPAWPKEIGCEDFNLGITAVECVATIAVFGCLAAAGASGVGLPVALACDSAATFVADKAGPDCLNGLLAGIEQYLGVGQASPPPDDLAGDLEQIPNIWCSVTTATSLRIVPDGDKVVITAEDDAGSSVAGTPVYLATAGTLAGGTATVSGSTGCFQPVGGIPPPCPSTVSASGVGFVTGTSGLTITYTAPASPPSAASEDLLASLSVLNTPLSPGPCPSGPQTVPGINALGCTPLWPTTPQPSASVVPNQMTSSWLPPNRIDSNRVLESISCASSLFCVAVDDAGNALTFNGTSWSSPQLIDPNNSLLSVSCPSTKLCAATDSDGSVLMYNGSFWSSPHLLVASKGYYYSNAIYSVSCPSSSFCMTVANNGESFAFNGYSWSAAGQFDPSGLPFAVSCATESFCLSADNAGNIFRYDGSSWVGPHFLEAPAANGSISSLSCRSPSFCVAVDYFGNAFIYGNGSWTSAERIDRGVAQLHSVSCPSSNFCMAVDTAGRVIRFDYNSWSPPQVINPTKPNPVPAADVPLGSLDGISCPSASFCVAIDNIGDALIYR